MRKLTRLLVGVVLFAAVLAHYAPPAGADHGVGTTEQPPSGSGTVGDDAAGWHEEEPDFAIAQPSDPCVVTGTVDPGIPFNNDTHFPSVPLVNDDPSHSHFAFINSIIDCPLSDGALAVTADGGNDGHMIDLFCGPMASPDPTCGDPMAPGWSPLEADLDDQICSTVHPSLCMGAPVDGGDQHEFNSHHGSENESGWSHSSLYSGGPGGAESNVCSAAATTANQNKADIVVNGNAGWVKYVRIGVVVYAWGCVPGLAPFDVFSSVLLILPNVLPADVPGIYPGDVLNPLCPLEFLNDPPFNVGGPMQPCGFILAGIAVRGDDWLL